MREQPERSEVGIALLGEDAPEVRLDPGGPREARVVADDAEGHAVRRQPPQRAVLRVEVLLREPERVAPPPAIAERRRERLKPAPRGSDDDRDAPTQRCVADGVHAL